MHEFFCEPELVDHVMDDISKCDFKRSQLMDKQQYAKVGYPKTEHGHESFYNEKLYKWLDECLAVVAEKYLTNLSLRICDMWVVQAKFGQGSELHNHSMSMFSGLLYLDDCKRSETVFECENSLHNSWDTFLGTNLKPNKIVQKVTPQKGKLIIWPSALHHRISPHTDKHTRHSIAFNAFVEGNIKTYTARLSLKVGNGVGPEHSFDFVPKQ